LKIKKNRKRKDSLSHDYSLAKKIRRIKKIINNKHLEKDRTSLSVKLVIKLFHKRNSKHQKDQTHVKPSNKSNRSSKIKAKTT
jgi:hypothetical protein